MESNSEVRIDNVVCFGGPAFDPPIPANEIRVRPTPGLIVDPLIILDLLGRVGFANEMDDAFKSSNNALSDPSIPGAVNGAFLANFSKSLSPFLPPLIALLLRLRRHGDK